MAPRGQGKKKPLLPGCGRPLDYVPNEFDPDYVGDLFPNALSPGQMASIGLSALTLREIDMLQFMNHVTDKSEWFTKVNDEEIAKKWKEEVCSNDELDFTPKMADWCIDELRYIASFHSASPENPPPIVVLHGDVVKSDTAVSTELKNALQEAVHNFQVAIPENLKDWHPGSDGKVLDLVHPSLCPLVYGRTRILCDGETTTLDDCIERCGQGEIVDIPECEPEPTPYNTKVFSTNFQWLPCEVDISGERSRITSYINNLHPKKERGLYELIERLIDAAIPLWNVALAPLGDESFNHQLRIKYTAVEYDLDRYTWPESEKLQQGPGEDDYSYWEREEEWIKANRNLVYPEPEEEFQPRQPPSSLDLKTEFCQRGLQVIIKLANIQLTPEKPDYDGGTWHVEGQMNEHIVSTALYYYSSENITTSTLGFRQICQVDDVHRVSYRQSDHDWLGDIFGCENWSEAVQDVGSVETREGRLITFPNVLQHRVAPFKLADPTKAGHRKIVAMFLVDPNIKITSTANVPCQQQEWWWERIMPTPGQIPRIPELDSGFSKIPIELQHFILEGVDFPFSLAEAKARRLELMKERKSFTFRHGNAFPNAIQFSLCEH